MEKAECLRIISTPFLCLCWYAVSSATGIIGKWILREFPHPMTVTLVQSVTIATLSPILIDCLRIPNVDIGWKYYAKVIVPLALLKFVSNVFANISIWKSSVSYAHTVSGTLFTCSADPTIAVQCLELFLIWLF